MERLNDIHEAVNSVMNQTLKPYEIVLSVDHNEELFESLQSSVISDRSSIPPLGSSQQTQQTQRTQSTPQTKVVHNTGVLGVSETRSFGIRAASGDLIACMDDDAIAERNWLETIVASFSQDRPVAVIGGKCVLVWPKEKRPFWFPEELDWIVGGTYKGMPVSSNGEIRNVSSCNMLARKDIFEEVGFFNSRMGAVKGFLRGGEEAEFCLRVKETSPEKVILYDPRAIVHHKVHPHRLTLKYVAKRSFDEGFSKAKLEKLSAKSTRPTLSAQQTLSTESSYLRYILFSSIPGRLRCFYKKGSLSQLGAIIISMVATGVGYFIGRIKRRH
jgi:GT2 family glycosyltransferase